MTHVADSGTLCTLSSSDEAGPEGSPFGSHVDYVLDEQVSVQHVLMGTSYCPECYLVFMLAVDRKQVTSQLFCVWLHVVDGMNLFNVGE